MWGVGSINSAEIELRPLTVFIGRNSTGKSYAALTIYALVRAFNEAAIGSYVDFVEKWLPSKYRERREAIEHILKDMKFEKERKSE